MDGFERRRQKTLTAIVESAIELFQSQGVQATSVDEICERAEVSVRTFFNHFETRQHLHDFIAHRRAKETGDALRAAVADPRPFEVRLTEFFDTIAGYLAERPAYRDFVGEMLQLHPARGYEAVRPGELFAGVRVFVADAQERHEIDAVHSVDAIADLVVASIVQLTANWSASASFDVRTAASETTSLLCGLCVDSRASV